MNRLFLVLFIVFIKIQVFAQINTIKLGNEYFSQQEFEKAYNEYQKIVNDDQALKQVYANYIVCLTELKKLSEQEKFFKKIQKKFPNEDRYFLDGYVFNFNQYGSDKTKKEFQKLLEKITNTENQSAQSIDYFLKKNLKEQALEIIQYSRKRLNNPLLFTDMYALMLYQQNRKEEAVEQIIIFLQYNPTSLEDVKSMFQDLLTQEGDFDILENKLYDLVSKNPEELAYNELLLWLNIQKRNFNRAFNQARALERRNFTDGKRMMDVGEIAIQNKAYYDAIKYFQYVIDNNKSSRYYPIARRELINAKELNIKNSYPIQQDALNTLIIDYKKLIDELGYHPSAMEARRSLALIYGFYINEKDTAILILNGIINNGRVNRKLVNLSKIDLADIYLLKNEPWESTLLYSQVEKEMKEDLIGHQAKLKNAKLNYYKGDFQLAQEHLDVLKMATTREISNDAMQLSLLIQDNIGMDTSTDAMEAYAAIDLLLFQNQPEEALEKSNQLLTKYKNHSLTDEIFWLQANILYKMRKIDETIAVLDNIIESYPDDILGDDALFKKCQIYDLDKKDDAQAMDLYAELMRKYPGSIHTAEARKRFRTLRGDKL